MATRYVFQRQMRFIETNIEVLCINVLFRHIILPLPAIAHCQLLISDSFYETPYTP